METSYDIDVHYEPGRTLPKDEKTTLRTELCRLAAEYTLVHNAFTTPLDEQLLASLRGQRAGRLDGHADGYSPIDSKEWSASGATR